ncbi:MAG TPA: hypothetical protein VIH57_03030, partial [Bacteroidales bacterium]
MKAKIIIQIFTALFLSACSSSYFAKSGNDDLYYSPSKGSTVAQTQPVVTSGANTNTSKATSTVNSRNDQQMTDYEKYRKSLDEREIADTTDSTSYAGNTDIQNAADSKEPVVKSDDYYGEGGDTYVYNNYYYTSRLNRFHGGFYDPYFYDPFYFDSWYDPWYYSPGWSFSIGFGWGWGSPYYYDPYYYPYYGGYWGYYGYNPYWRGYYGHGFYEGYHYNNWGSGYYRPTYSYGRIPNRSGLTN